MGYTVNSVAIQNQASQSRPGKFHRRTAFLSILKPKSRLRFGTPRALRRGKIDSRSWNAAIRAVQQDIFAMGARRDVSDQEDRVLTAVFLRCEELRARKYLAFKPTNRQLAKKYAVSPRTVTNWRKKGCPFDKGNGKCSIGCLCGPTCRAERKRNSLATSTGDSVARAWICEPPSFYWGCRYRITSDKFSMR